MSEIRSQKIDVRLYYTKRGAFEWGSRGPAFEGCGALGKFALPGVICYNRACVGGA